MIENATIFLVVLSKNHAHQGSAHQGLTHWGLDKMANIFQMIFSEAFSLIKMYEFRLRFHWIKLVPKGPINNIPALVQIMAWHWPGIKPLSEPVMVSLLPHIYVMLPQWGKVYNINKHWRYHTCTISWAQEITKQQDILRLVVKMLLLKKALICLNILTNWQFLSRYSNLGNSVTFTVEQRNINVWFSYCLKLFFGHFEALFGKQNKTWFSFHQDIVT